MDRPDGNLIRFEWALILHSLYNESFLGATLAHTLDGGKKAPKNAPISCLTSKEWGLDVEQTFAVQMSVCQ